MPIKISLNHLKEDELHVYRESCSYFKQNETYQKTECPLLAEQLASDFGKMSVELYRKHGHGILEREPLKMDYSKMKGRK